ncbi:MAG: adenosylcobinamide-phosphate synthase CbiB [Anaerolineae bacterium]
MPKFIVILLALGLDLLLGDPPNRFHPVVLMGNWLSLGRRRAPARHRFWFGAGWLVGGIALFTQPWRIFRVTNYELRITNIVLMAVPLKLVLAYRNLRGAARQVQAALAADNLPEARRLLSWHLVSRDTSALTAEEVAGAAIESLAENVTDSVTAPLGYFAAGGLPAVWGYRLVNTADAMWGYRTEELEQLGKFAARLDDALNWLPARLTGGLMVPSAWLAGEDWRQAARVMWRQHSRTASPNAGWTMAATAGALNITLTKRGVYELAGGDAPISAATISRAIRLADGAVLLAVWLLGVMLNRRGAR